MKALDFRQYPMRMRMAASASICPTSTPMLKEMRLSSRPSGEILYSRIFVASPKPWKSPKMSVAAFVFG